MKGSKMLTVRLVLTFIVQNASFSLSLLETHWNVMSEFVQSSIKCATGAKAASFFNLDTYM